MRDSNGGEADLEPTGAGDAELRAEAERERRELVARIASAAARERRRLARALHDGPVQDLLAAKLLVSGTGEGDSLPRKELDEILARTVKQLRETIFFLFPPSLERLGLEAALNDLVDQVSEREQCNITLRVDPDTTGVHDQVLYALCRELLQNAVRHAHAQVIEIRVERGEAEIAIEVEDDGVGLSPTRLREARRQGHIGLASHAERVEALGGTFGIQAVPGGGTLIRATLPSRRETDVGPTAAVGDRARRTPRETDDRRWLSP